MVAEAGRAGRLRSLAVVAALLVLVGSAFVAWPRDALVVRSAPLGGTSDSVLLEVPLGRGEDLELRYTHSFNRFSIHELLRHEPGRGFVVHAQYVDGDGAGIGEVPGEATFVGAGNGWSRLDGLDRELPDPLLLRLGTVADHRVVVADREHRLLALAPGGTRVSLNVETVAGTRWLRAAMTQQRAHRAAPRTATEQPGS